MSFLEPWWPLLLQGAVVSLQIIFWVAILSTILAVFVALALVSERKWLRNAVRVYVETFRSIPDLVLLLVLYFGLGAWVGAWGIPAFWVAIIGLALSQAAYTGDLYRAAIKSVRQEQMEAAYSIGLTRRQAYWRVILPQAVTPAIAPTASQMVIVVKGSALASLITVPELLLAARQVIQNTFMVLETYAVVAVFYLALTIPLIYLGRFAERRLTRKDVRTA